MIVITILRTVLIKTENFTIISCSPIDILGLDFNQLKIIWGKLSFFTVV